MKIYYFSGTGNSFAVAKNIAKKVNAELISIPSVIHMDKIQVDAESIGIIFPSYLAPLSGVPLIAERFVRKIANIGSIYIFAVCTCGGYECVNALPSLKRLRHIIRSCGGKLSAEYSVRLPMNNLDYDHIPIPIVRDQEIIINKSKAKIDDICYRIINKRGTKYKTVKKLFGLLMTPLYKLIRQSVTNDLKGKAKEPMDTGLKYFELIPLTDKSIIIDEKCNGCGTCEKVCPVNNIKIVDKKPEFQHKCEMCFACDEWCPYNAIHHWSRPEGVKYHHPEVKISDMLCKKVLDGN
ncbi:MAG: EFR1 family ferrodoxin [Clostridia bacterium]|jgi:ferredoxin/flavodoxin|nr:EFR1 family ferrodoxin [Clostridia bacterium]